MNTFINFIKGIVIGITVVIPGFSASTFIVVLGLYEKMIHSLNNLRKEFKRNVVFLLPIALGAAVGVMVSAGFVIFLIEEFTLQSYSLFIGLVLGSVPVIYRKMKPGLKSGKNYAFMLLGLIAIIALTFLTPYTSESTAITSIESPVVAVSIFSAGIVSCVLMAFPGISGSIILMLMGMFETVYGAVSNFGEMILMLIRGESGIVTLGISSAGVLLVYLGGAILGLFLAAKLMGYLITKYETAVYFMVLGLVLGAVITLVDLGVVSSFLHTESFFEVILNAVMLLGFGVIGFILTRLICMERPKSSP